MTHTLKHIASLQTGYSLRGKPSVGDVPIIQMGDINQEVPSINTQLTRATIPTNAAKYAVEPGEILFLARGRSNFAIEVPPHAAGAVPVSLFFILRNIHPEVHPAYLAWYLNSEAAQKQMDQSRTYSSVPMISKASLAELSIPIPPMEIQQGIAQLSRLQAREQQLLHRLADLRGQTINQKLLTLI